VVGARSQAALQQAIDEVSKATFVSSEKREVPTTPKPLLEKVKADPVETEWQPVGDDGLSFADRGFIGELECSAFSRGSPGLAAGDVDADGDPDLVTVTGKAGIQAWQNRCRRGQLDFQPLSVETSFTTSPLELIDVALADLDADGDLDIITASRDAGLVLHPQTIQDSRISFARQIVIDELRVGRRDGLSVIGVDLDSDADCDLVTATDRSFARMFLQRDTCDAEGFRDFMIGRTDSDSYANVGLDHGDFNGDGRVDLVAITKKSGLLLFLQKEMEYLPKFDRIELMPCPDGFTTTITLTVVDIDRDGDLDLFTASAKPGVVYFENTGTHQAPGFTVRGVVGDPASQEKAHADIASVDIDGDGDIDLVTASSKGIKLFENTGKTEAVPE
jgi:hypothetical protein